jgi:hypothetical protein
MSTYGDGVRPCPGDKNVYHEEAEWEFVAILWLPSGVPLVGHGVGRGMFDDPGSPPGQPNAIESTLFEWNGLPFADDKFPGRYFDVTQLTATDIKDPRTNEVSGRELGPGITDGHMGFSGEMGKAGAGLSYGMGVASSGIVEAWHQWLKGVCDPEAPDIPRLCQVLGDGDEGNPQERSCIPSVNPCVLSTSTESSGAESIEFLPNPTTLKEWICDQLEANGVDLNEDPCAPPGPIDLTGTVDHLCDRLAEFLYQPEQCGLQVDAGAILNGVCHAAQDVLEFQEGTFECGPLAQSQAATGSADGPACFLLGIDAIQVECNASVGPI